MNTSPPGRLSRTEIARSYFRRIDSGDFPAEYYTADFEFYVPKFGIGRGAGAFDEMVQGIYKTRISSRHHFDSLQCTEFGDKVVVEGTTEGLGVNNVGWCGGKTPGGRFCSVFQFDDENLIKRMYIYLDPDFTGADKDRFLWRRSQAQW